MSQFDGGPRLRNILNAPACVEQRPYALASLIGDADPLQRWPQLALDSGVPSGSDRRSQAVYMVRLPATDCTGGPATNRPISASQCQSRLTSLRLGYER